MVVPSTSGSGAIASSWCVNRTQRESARPSVSVKSRSLDGPGALTDRATQQWVKLTGRRVDLAEGPWLRGPIGKPTGIGRSYFEDLAAEQGLQLRRSREPRGLVASL